MHHVSPIVERFKTRASSFSYVFIRAYQSADDVVYHFMRLLKQKLSRAVKATQRARIMRRNQQFVGSTPGSFAENVVKFNISRYERLRLICEDGFVFTRVAPVAAHKRAHHFLIALERHSPPSSFTAGKQRPVSIPICSLCYFSVSPPTPRGYHRPAFAFYFPHRVCWSRGPRV